jgi:hypothetical protein
MKATLSAVFCLLTATLPLFISHATGQAQDGAGPADWTSLSTARWDRTNDPWASAPPVAEGKKVVLLDTDHISWKIFIDDTAFTRAWVWKSFTRGYSTLLMENLSDSAGWIAVRAAMGHTSRYAERMDLTRTTPQPTLATTGYCLARVDPHDPQYLVYLPEAGSVTVDLSGTQGDLAVEWFHPESGETTKGKAVQGGGSVRFQTPFESKDSVLYLHQEE